MVVSNHPASAGTGDCFDDTHRPADGLANGYHEANDCGLAGGSFGACVGSVRELGSGSVDSQRPILSVRHLPERLRYLRPLRCRKRQLVSPRVPQFFRAAAGCAAFPPRLLGVIHRQIESVPQEPGLGPGSLLQITSTAFLVVGSGRSKGPVHERIPLANLGPTLHSLNLKGISLSVAGAKRAFGANGELFAQPVREDPISRAGRSGRFAN
jgi:hypothetical protein